jgi:hypothetical protein
MTTIEDYHRMLGEHSHWHYQCEEMSDRYEVGRAAHFKLRDISRESREHLVLWNAWNDYVYGKGALPELSIHLRPINDPRQMEIWRS